MAYYDFTIDKLRRTFIPPFKEEDGKYESKSPFTNCALVFAYNGTGKTRLSYEFAHYARRNDTPQHTLYYNAYTEDLFTWDNDFENETDHRLHRLIINKQASLIRGLAGSDFTVQLRKYLHVFADIDFELKYDKDEIPDYVLFSKTIKERTIESIKISRGEERIFVWCFFRCILDQVVGGNPAYKDIEYIYIDDPMSSLDDNNVIAFAEQLYSVIRQQLSQEISTVGKKDFRRIKFIVSSHHALFFHVMQHGLSADKKLGRFYLSRNKQNNKLVLKYMGKDDPFYYNVAMMSELKKAIENDNLYTFHFTILRSVMEKIKEFFGQRSFTFILEGIKYKGETYDKTAFSQEDLTDFYSRVMNVLTHQGPMFSPAKMNDDNKELAKAIFDHLMESFPFKLPELDDFHSEE